MSNDDFVDDVYNLSPLGKSDHSVLHCVCNLFNIVSVNVSKLNYNKGDYSGLCEHVNNIFDKERYTKCASANDSWVYLKSVVDDGVKLFVPHVKGNDWRRKT